jgi:hypothetical protein
MKQGFFWLLLVLVAGLAFLAGLRLSGDGLAVVVGVVCGVVAGLPVDGVLLYLYLRERQVRREVEERLWRGERAMPPVVVVNSGRGVEMLPGGLGYGRMPLGERAGREFTIVGEEEQR